MADNIKGIKVVFDADTSQFKKGLKDFDKDLRSTQNQLKETNKSLRLEFDEKKLVNAQKLAQKAIKGTEERANILKNRMKVLETAGITDKNRAEYEKLQTELLKTENKSKVLQRQLKDLNNVKLDKLSKSVTKLGDNMQKAGRAMAPVSAAAGAALAGLTAAGLKAIKVGDDIATTSIQLNMSAEALQRYKYIAMQTDVSNEQMMKGFRKLRETVGRKLTGQTNYATQALDDLGFTMEQLSTMSNEEMFDATVKKLSEMEDSTMQAAYANQIFTERVANDLIPLLKTSTGTMEELNAEFEASGYMTNEQVKNLAEFDNVMNKIKTSITNAALQIGIAMLPVMQELAVVLQDRVVPALQKFSAWFGELETKHKKMITAGLAIVTALAPVLLIVGKLTSVVGGFIPMISKLGFAFKALLGPVGIILAIITLLYTTNESFREAINNLIGTLMNALMPIIGMLGDVFNQLMDTLMPIVNMLGDTLASVINQLVPVINELIGALMPLINDVLSAMLPILMQNIDTYMILVQAMMPLVTLLLDMLIPALDMLMPVLKIYIKLIQWQVNLMSKLVSWIGNLAQSFIKLVVSALEPVIEKLQLVWNFIKKILGIKDKAELEVDVSYNDTGPNLKTKQIDEGFTQQDNLKGMVTSNNQALSTMSNTTNNVTDNSTKNFTVNLTVENYGAELDYETVAERINLELAKQY